MNVVVYGFVDAEATAIDGAGLAERPLRMLAEGEVAAVVSDHDAPRLECNGPNLWDYERVMERLMASRAIVPARFGTVLAGDREVRALVRQRHGELKRGLGLVRGAVELGTRARWRPGAAPAVSTPPAEPGTAYMASRVALHRRVRDLAQRLDPLAALARDVRVRLDEDAEFPVREAHLVERSQLATFAEAVRTLDEREPDIELVCTGPWPPYSFAREIDAAPSSGREPA